MRKGIAFLTALMLGLLASAACAEGEIIRLEFIKLPAMNQTWQLTDDADSLTLRSSLHSRTALVWGKESPVGLPALTEQLAGWHALPGAGQIQHVLTGWLKEIGAVEETGIYTGDSFDRASVRLSAEVRAEELRGLAERLERIRPRTEAAASGFQSAVRGIRRMETILRQDSGIGLQIAAYDGGNALVIQLERDGGTVLMLSVDLAEMNHIQAVLSFAENGQIYDLGLQSLMDPNHRLTCTVTLCSDPEKAGYRQASQNHPILTLSAMMNETEGKAYNHEWNLQGTLSSAQHGILMQWEGLLNPIGSGAAGKIHLCDGRGEPLGELILDYGTESDALSQNENRIDLRQETDPASLLLLERLYIQFGLMALQACLLR